MLRPAPLLVAVVLAVSLPACALTRAAPTPAPEPSARARAVLPNEPPLPTVPHQFSDCRALTWAAIGSAVVGAVSIYIVGTGVDTLNPDPAGPLPDGLRRLKFGAGVAGAGATVLTVSLTSLLGQCRDDQTKAGE